MSTPPAPLRRMRLSLAVLLLGFTLAAPAQAQDHTTRILLERLAGLEQSVRDLERQVYRGSPPPSGGMTPPPTQSAELEVRLMQLDQALRGLTGQVEENQHQARQLQQRLEALSNDMDRRLAELEQTVNELRQRGPAGPGIASADQAAPQPVTPSYGVAAQSPSRSAALAPPPAAQAPVGSVLPPGTPEEQYKFATGLVRQRNFPDAERAFREFLALYPEHELAPNAQYWLGETLYVRQLYEDAARTFLAGYQRYPDSPKATDSLLKLGVTLNQMGQRNEACATFDELLRRLPQNERRLRPKAEFEWQNSGCK